MKRRPLTAAHLVLQALKAQGGEDARRVAKLERALAALDRLRRNGRAGRAADAAPAPEGPAPLPSGLKTAPATRLAGSANEFVGSGCGLVGSSNEFVGSGCELVGSSNEFVGSGCEMVGSSNEFVGSGCELVGSSNEFVGSGCEMVGSSNEFVGSGGEMVGSSNEFVGSGGGLVGSSCEMVGSANETRKRVVFRRSLPYFRRRGGLAGRLRRRECHPALRFCSSSSNSSSMAFGRVVERPAPFGRSMVALSLRREEPAAGAERTVFRSFDAAVWCDVPGSSRGARWLLCWRVIRARIVPRREYHAALRFCSSSSNSMAFGRQCNAALRVSPSRGAAALLFSPSLCLSSLTRRRPG